MGRNCEILNMKLDIWLDIPSKYIDDFCVIVSVIVGIIFRKINWHVLSEFYPLVFGISLAMVKTDVKNVLLNSIFSRTGLSLFFVFCVICLVSASWVLFLNQKAIHCVLSFWLICDMLRSSCCFHSTLHFFKFRRDFVLSLQILELVQTKSSMSSHSVRFSSGVLNLSRKI